MRVKVQIPIKLVTETREWDENGNKNIIEHTKLGNVILLPNHYEDDCLVEWEDGTFSWADLKELERDYRYNE